MRISLMRLNPHISCGFLFKRYIVAYRLLQQGGAKKNEQSDCRREGSDDSRDC